VGRPNRCSQLRDTSPAAVRNVEGRAFDPWSGTAL